MLILAELNKHSAWSVLNSASVLALQLKNELGDLLNLFIIEPLVCLLFTPASNKLNQIEHAAPITQCNPSVCSYLIAHGHEFGLQ
jgi:hypothetical protein